MIRFSNIRRDFSRRGKAPLVWKSGDLEALAVENQTGIEEAGALEMVPQQGIDLHKDRAKYAALAIAHRGTEEAVVRVEGAFDRFENIE